MVATVNVAAAWALKFSGANVMPRVSEDAALTVAAEGAPNAPVLGVRVTLADAFPLFRTPARQNQIVALALKRRLASLSDLPIADKGLLATFGADAQTFIDRTASYVDRILKGAKPADLPVEQPTKFNLVVNLKTAMAIGLTIPQSILLRADRVIE